MIRHLPANVRACIRTGVALTSFAQAVEELVLNAIDAGANSIAVRVDFSCFKVQVVDNGAGISLDQFQLIGERYSTSKCHGIEDLQNLKYFGYRGEALASLRTAASFLEIVSRSKSSVITHSKCFQNGNVLDIIQASQPRPSAGTTVTAHDLFYNLPVRRKCLNGVLEMEKVRYRLAGIALMWPHISFSLRDDSIGHVILQTHKCSGMAASFSYIFTPARARGLMEVSAERDEFKLSGLVSKESYSRMDLQFVFVNKRLMLKSSIHRQINKILGRSLILRRKGLTSDGIDKNMNAGGTNTGSPQKQLERYAIFVVNIECPYKVYDVTFDPSKTLVEFHNWPKLIHLLQDMMYGFLRKENLMSIAEPTYSVSPYDINNEDANDDADGGEDSYQTTANDMLCQSKNGDSSRNVQLGVKHKLGRNISAVMENGLFSKSVHRPKILNLENVQVSSGQSKSVKDLSKESHSASTMEQFLPCAKEAISLNENLQMNEKDQSTFLILDSSSNGNSQKESESVLTHFNPNRGIAQENSEAVVDQDAVKKYKDQTFQQRLCPCPLSSEGEDIDTESLSGANRPDIHEDSEEVIVMGPQSSEIKEITLGKGVHYSSSLKSLRDIKQASSTSTVSIIITNTLQQLRQSTHRAVTNVEELYKTPEKVTILNEESPSPAKQPKMDNSLTMANKNSGLNKDRPILNEARPVLNEDRPIFNESVNTCKSKHTKGCHSFIEGKLSIESKNQFEAENVIESNDMPLHGGDSSSSATFKSTKEDRSLGQNDRGIGLKRTLNHTVSHASKLAKLIRGKSIVDKPQYIHTEDGHCPDTWKHSEKLNEFSYRKSNKNVRFKHGEANKYHMDSSDCIQNKSWMGNAEITNKNLNDDIFSWDTSISAEHLLNGKEGKRDSDREGWIVGESTSSNTQTICSANRCCQTVCQTSRQLGHTGNDMPFNIYRTPVDIVEQTQDVLDNSPKVSVILSLPIESVKSKTSLSETWDRPEIARSVLLSDQNQYNDTGQSIAVSKANCTSIGSATAYLPLRTLDIVSYSSQDNEVLKRAKCSTNHSYTCTELMSKGSCFVQEQLPTSCQEWAEGKYFGSKIEAAPLSQGFSVTITQLDSVDCTTSSEGLSSVGFESAGFSPTRDVTSPTDEDSCLHTQSCITRTSVQYPFSKTTDSPVVSIRNNGLLNSHSDIQDMETRDKSAAILHTGSVSSAKTDSDILIGNTKNNETYCNLNSQLTFSDIPNDGDIRMFNVTAIESSNHHVAACESAVCDEPVILAYDSLNEYNVFSTVPETDNTERNNLDTMNDNAFNNDLLLAASSKGGSKCKLNSLCNEEENGLTDVENMIAGAKQMFKSMKQSLGILDSEHDPDINVSALQSRHKFVHSQSRGNSSGNIAETTSYSELDKSGKMSPRTFIQHHTSDCELILLPGPHEEDIPQDNMSLNVRSASSKDSIECGQRNLIGNDDADMCLVSSLSDSLRSDSNYQGTRLSVCDSSCILSTEDSELASGHLKKILCLSDPLSSQTLLNEISQQSRVQDFTCVNGKDVSQIPSTLGQSEVKHTKYRSENKFDCTEVNNDCQIYNTSQYRDRIEKEASLKVPIKQTLPHLSDNKDLSSQNDLIDIMSSEGDQLLMMVEEPVLSTTILSHESKNYVVENRTNESNNRSQQLANGLSVNEELNLGAELSEMGKSSVTSKSINKDDTGVNDNSLAAETVRTSDVGLSSFGAIESRIVLSSLSLLRPAGLIVEPENSYQYQSEHSDRKDACSREMNFSYHVKLSISATENASNVGKAANSEKAVPFNSEKDVGFDSEKAVAANSEIDVAVANSEKYVVSNSKKAVAFNSETADAANLEKAIAVSSQKDVASEEADADLDIQKEETNPTRGKQVYKSAIIQSQDGITKTACWKEVTDPETGQTTYINNKSGHTVNKDQWTHMSSQAQKEMLAIPSECAIVAPGVGPAVFKTIEKQAFQDLVNDHFEQEEAEAVSKWRKGQRPVYDKNAEADVSALMARWTNPVFLSCKQPGQVVDMCPSGAVARSCFTSLSLVEFTKNMLNTLKVIGQLDNKFIACVIEKPEDFSKAIGSRSSSLLVLFDQHAVHERIRLEHFTRDVYDENDNGERTDCIKRSEVKPAQSVTVDQDDLRIMKAFGQEFNRIGISFTVDKINRNKVLINSFPSCMLEKDASELKRNKIAGVIESVEGLIKEHIELLKSTNGACGRLPLTIHKVLCSQACHGAVKFGDKLTLQECRDLLSSLASCNLPFQCAHGRPSVAPLVNLSVLEKELFSARMRPNLWRISQALQKVTQPT